MPPLDHLLNVKSAAATLTTAMLAQPSVSRYPVADMRLGISDDSCESLTFSSLHQGSATLEILCLKDPISAADLNGAVSESKAISESEYKRVKMKLWRWFGVLLLYFFEVMGRLPSRKYCEICPTDSDRCFMFYVNKNGTEIYAKGCVAEADCNTEDIPACKGAAECYISCCATDDCNVNVGAAVVAGL
ncbi:hypothetical protein OS493_005344 [Desmophyllum pertusum]|uniref:Uncharacterized protein n=1 Tax=Desmophyllum pertusum TaxID=174260 RepID=A0A9X0CLR3_9CNID|nr:hypothetical protein OS493_005344 [Desmophyllum pertusum]